MATCGMCYGKGTNLERTDCDKCGGRGNVPNPDSYGTGEMPCQKCSGNGFYPKKITCERCDGKGTVED